MIIGFLGKGGSGKSTASHRFARFLHDNKKKVLTIDLDHNMDMSFNLGVTDETFPNFPYLGVTAKDVIYKYSKIKDGEYYDDLFTKDDYVLPVFNAFGDRDLFTRTFTKDISDRLSTMIMGPHADKIIQGGGCSHFMAVSMKIYLPLLELKDDEYVVIDEKASTDSAGTGIPSGFDVAYICVENTPHSIKTAKLIAGLLEEINTPYEYVANKVRDIDKDIPAISEALGKKPVTALSMDINYLDPQSHADEEATVFLELLRDIENKKQMILNGQSKTRLERTREKFAKHKKYREAI